MRRTSKLGAAQAGTSAKAAGAIRCTRRMICHVFREDLLCVIAYEAIQNAPIALMSTPCMTAFDAAALPDLQDPQAPGVCSYGVSPSSCLCVSRP